MMQAADDLPAHVQATLAAAGLSDAPVCVAFSGGIDSTVLLHALSCFRGADALRAVHVNHALHTDAELWAQHCAAVCAAWGIPFVALRVSVASQSANGPEAAARSARYAALRGQLQHSEVLLTAHQQRDQLETVLLAMLRGSGLEGLAAMPAVGSRDGMSIVRPLLDIHPDRIGDYARQHGLTWITDPSNADEAFDRNYLRARVVPLLEHRWPAAARAASRSARWCGEAAAIVYEVAAADSAAGLHANCLELGVLRGLTPARRRNLLRYVARVLGLPTPQAAQLQALLTAVLRPRAHLMSSGHWPGVVVRRYRERLWFYSTPADPGCWPPMLAARPWQYPDDFDLGQHSGQLEWVSSAAGGIGPEYLARGLEVRPRVGGERLRLRPDGPRRSLKNLLQEAGVVPWMRPFIPLVYAGEQLLAVGDLWLNADCCVPRGQPGRQIIWRDRPVLE